MKASLVRILFAAFLMALVPVALAQQESCTLTVQVTQLKSDSGQVMVSLFDKPDGFPGGGPDAAIQTLTTTAAAGVASVIFEKLACGTYAVAAHHDEDGDGKMKSVYGTIPLEGVGVSNDAKGIMGPPKYKDASFELTSNDESIVIIMRY